MGSVSRMDRGDRFVAEFGDDYLRALGVAVGTVLTVKDAAVENEFDQDGVVLNLTLTGPDGGTQKVQSDKIFDPEWDHGDDLVERVAEALSLAPEVVRERLQSADLL